MCIRDRYMGKNEVVIQLPYNPTLLPTEEEIKHRQEMRKEQGKRLKEYMQKKREEKKLQMMQEYTDLKNINKLKDEDRDSFRECYLSCLLYTSPSPRDLSTSRMPSSA
eukprot:TRINITY_DN3496_c0_g1_i5.p2 TRINITY_DN3496_c0_g1~~TRINITY_DN3496_c0_g1_i5.p2  ORF type:complete len:108 (+),score=37.63 TRINITY_DN3496_c0_g1_i5:165-488(+)